MGEWRLQQQPGRNADKEEALAHVLGLPENAMFGPVADALRARCSIALRAMTPLKFSSHTTERTAHFVICSKIVQIYSKMEKCMRLPTLCYTPH